MKFEFSDEQALLVSGLGCAAFSTFAIVAPQKYHDTFGAKASAGAVAKAQPYSEGMTRWMGHALLGKGATDIVLSRSEAKPIKDTLKITGACWLTAAAHMAWRAHDGSQNREASIAAAVGQSLVGALCMYRGFADD